KRSVLIKNQFDENRTCDVEERGKNDSKECPPNPPGALGYSKDRINNGESDWQNDERNSERFERLAEPGAEGLVRHSILMFAHKTLVTIQRQIQRPRDNGETDCVDAGLDRSKAR